MPRLGLNVTTLVYFRGGQTGGPCPTADSWLFDARTLKWKKLPTCASARTMAALALLPIVNEQRRVILYGGEEEGPGYNVIRVSKHCYRTNIATGASLFEINRRTTAHPGQIYFADYNTPRPDGSDVVY